VGPVTTQCCHRCGRPTGNRVLVLGDDRDQDRVEVCCEPADEADCQLIGALRYERDGLERALWRQRVIYGGTLLVIVLILEIVLGLSWGRR
jgi:hypothetical protein